MIPCCFLSISAIPKKTRYQRTTDRPSYRDAWTHLKMVMLVDTKTLEGKTQFLGSDPDRRQSPVEWGNFLSIHWFINLSVHPSIPPSGTARPEAKPVRPEPGLSLRSGWLASDLARWVLGLAGYV